MTVLWQFELRGWDILGLRDAVVPPLKVIYHTKFFLHPCFDCNRWVINFIYCELVNGCDCQYSQPFQLKINEVCFMKGLEPLLNCHNAISSSGNVATLAVTVL